MGKRRKRRAPTPLTRKLGNRKAEPGSTAAELLRRIAAEDPEGHKARLGRAYGVGPETTVVDWKPADRPPLVVLERIEPDVTPDYCVHGKATCITCPEWVWLGDESHELVKSGAALAICVQCAARIIPPDSQRIGRVGDHRRADGPHS